MFGFFKNPSRAAGSTHGIVFAEFENNIDLVVPFSGTENTRFRVVLFNKFDVDGSGHLDIEEFGNLMTHMHQMATTYSRVNNISGNSADDLKNNPLPISTLRTWVAQYGRGKAC